MAEKIQVTPKPSIPFPQRPMRLFRKPKPIQFDGERIEFEGRLGRVLNLWAPEILSSEWWDQGFERIYYRVLIESGEQYWIFRESESYFAHGIYD